MSRSKKTDATTATVTTTAVTTKEEVMNQQPIVIVENGQEVEMVYITVTSGIGSFTYPIMLKDLQEIRYAHNINHNHLKGKMETSERNDGKEKTKKQMDYDRDMGERSCMVDKLLSTIFMPIPLPARKRQYGEIMDRLDTISNDVNGPKPSEDGATTVAKEM